MSSSKSCTSPATTRSITWRSVQGACCCNWAGRSMGTKMERRRKKRFLRYRSGRLTWADRGGIGRILAEFVNQTGAKGKRRPLVGDEPVEGQIRPPVPRHAADLFQYIE